LTPQKWWQDLFPALGQGGESSAGNQRSTKANSSSALRMPFGAPGMLVEALGILIQASLGEEMVE
jgi:hypothetical protein